MALRKLKIASVRFTRAGEHLSSHVEDQRRKQLMGDLKSLCPRAEGLLNSSLDTYKLDDPQGVILEYWLYETEQRSLPLAIQRAGRHQDAGNDGFANDVTQLTREIHEAQNSFHVAVMPVYTAEQLRAPDIFTRKIRNVRKRVNQKDIFQIPTPDGAGLALTTGRQTHLPQSYRANIKAVVHSIVQLGAKLNDSVFIGNVPMGLDGIPIPNQILIRRPETASDLQLLRVLGDAMDSGKPVKLSALVNLDWVDGSIRSLTYDGIYKNPRKKRNPS